MLDITMTATRRPEILRRTLSSFKKYMLADVECRLIINIDPVGDDVTDDAVIAVATSCGFWNMTVRSPKTPSFPKAFKWAWLQTDSEYVLHLEDDWEMLRSVSLSNIIMTLRAQPKLALLRLPAFHANVDNMKNWNKFFPYDPEKGYFPCPEELKTSVGFCGHPSIIKREFIDKTVPYLDVRKNPEKQFHRGAKEIMEEVAKWEYGVYSSPNMPPAIRDIGRRWMVENKFRKAGAKAFFTNWEESK